MVVSNDERSMKRTSRGPFHFRPFTPIFTERQDGNRTPNLLPQRPRSMQRSNPPNSLLERSVQLLTERSLSHVGRPRLYRSGRPIRQPVLSLYGLYAGPARPGSSILKPAGAGQLNSIRLNFLATYLPNLDLLNTSCALIKNYYSGAK